MLNRNNFLSGLVLGLILPLVVFVLLFNLFSLLEIRGAASGVGLSPGFRERTLAIVAIAVNLMLLNLYQRRRWNESLRGVVIATGVLAILWLFRYGIHLF